MTYKEKYESCSIWWQKVKIMVLFHTVQKLGHTGWTPLDTAKYFHCSKSLVNENLALGKSLKEIKDLPSRKKALIFLRNH